MRSSWRGYNRLGDCEELPDDRVTTTTVIRQTGRDVFVSHLDRRHMIKILCGGTRNCKRVLRGKKGDSDRVEEDRRGTRRCNIR